MNSYNILNSINSVDDLRKLPSDQYTQLCDEIRNKLIETVSNNGGHLASNLGTVELTVALHLIFSTPTDQIVWDVGHQSYTHKLLTGRKDRFDSIRKADGLSGFTRHMESEHDAFLAGHSSTSISAAFGLAKAKSIKGEPGHAIAVIGDGAFTGGMAYEALNNAGRSKTNLIVILNDNSMSISKNVGALAKYLAVIRSKPTYFRMKDLLERVLDHTPLIGRPIKEWLTASKSYLKEILYHSTFFEDFGFAYMGPIDGHDIKRLTDVLNRAKSVNKPVFIHIHTTKGKGYEFAEKNPGAYHGVSKFNAETGNPDLSSEDTFSTVFGKYLVDLAETDSRICAITAAMKYGTGLQFFASKYRSRFFDVGIAEQHAVTFSAGLSVNGLIPVFAVYSTFLQRGYDQIIHDVAIENNKIILAIDRAGIVGEDGETHQGVFDVAFLSNIPNMTIFSPSNYAELKICLQKAIYKVNGPVAVRYPRGKESPNDKTDYYDDYFYSECPDADTLVITYGRLYSKVLEAKECCNKPVSVLKLVQISPINQKVFDIISRYKKVIFIEEGIKKGGIAEQIGCNLIEQSYNGKYVIKAIDDTFISQGSVDECFVKYGLDKDSILEYIKNI